MKPAAWKRFAVWKASINMNNCTVAQGGNDLVGLCAKRDSCTGKSLVGFSRFEAPAIYGS
jgi:hypothetical protein